MDKEPVQRGAPQSDKPSLARRNAIKRMASTLAHWAAGAAVLGALPATLEGFYYSGGYVPPYASHYSSMHQYSSLAPYSSYYGSVAYHSYRGYSSYTSRYSSGYDSQRSEYSSQYHAPYSSAAYNSVAYNSQAPLSKRYGYVSFRYSSLKD